MQKQVIWALSISATVLRKISTEVLKCWLYAGKHIRKHHENTSEKNGSNDCFA